MKTVHPDSVLVINKSYNLLIINKLHYLFTDLFTVYDFIYIYIYIYIYIPGFLKTGLVKISCFLRQKA